MSYYRNYRMRVKLFQNERNNVDLLLHYGQSYVITDTETRIKAKYKRGLCVLLWSVEAMQKINIQP